MDITSLIEIIVVIVVIYFFIKLIVSPIIKAVLGIIIFLAAVYFLQKYFGFNFDRVLAPFGISLNSNKWGLNLNWIFSLANYYIDQAKNFINFIWNNFPKNK